MTEHFPALSHDTLAAANLIGDWLAQDDLPQNAQPQIAVLAGNAVIPTIDAACRLAAQRQIPLLISGGIGHSTTFLYDAVQKHPHYQALQVEGRPESHILADIAEQFWQIPRDRIVVEDRSTNCGEKRVVYPPVTGRAWAGSFLWRGDSGSDDAASDDGDLCPRLAGGTGAAAVVELSRLFAAA
ncbi:Protein ydcF [Klebsiella aerogenes]|nr:Protein ydcF [Klebsiella aerogenes]